MKNCNHTGGIEPKEIEFYLYDHLGNTRVVYQPKVAGANLELVINYVADYFPYGKILKEYVNTGSGDPEKFLTTQHERDQETGLDYRGARYYDSDIARFLSLDPHATKYPSLSPYNYVGGNPIIFIDPDGKDIIYVEKGKEKRKLKRAINFERRVNSDFNTRFEKWKNEDVLHKLRWADAPTDKKISRGNTNVFGNPHSTYSEDGSKAMHYFHKQRILIMSPVFSEEITGDRINERGSASILLENLNIISGKVVVNYQMFGIPDELNVKDQQGNVITSTSKPVMGKGTLSESISNVVSLLININESQPNPDSQFKMNVSVYDDNSTGGKKTYTHTKGAYKEATENGFKYISE